ncbi:putative ribose/galactose/methyl galactoside import ATP-binding protein 1 [Streptomyces sulfonofaciens]|uniref:Ribose/galactose/methyl galactoside import ATP-binding protein 1 n=1 Tax=Streptomyces sulfonofaciens TaxID=68272 RepID=A0A919G8H4_9ACTN|nr:sugar ABC transporter ATP-binding protein [Streptomyces sulfonofaciens]GHH79368.1 putative ribose/galactose/methyl galactoside import ATP-binding protein 1 [Streptomyces sulfonofaciens]
MSTPPAAVVALSGLGKRFGAVWALRDLHMELRAGEVHALIGQNGSGKSTLIKTLAGYHEPDEGSIAVHGEPVRLPLLPRESARLGMAFLHQDAPVAPALTVTENIRVGRYEHRALGRIRWRRERERVRALLASVGLTADPDQPASRLPLAERALLGFATAVQALPERGGVLVLDEPTACLPPSGAQLLFRAVRKVTAAGSAVLFVSHRLDEVMAVSDRVSVLRDGLHVATVETAQTDRDELVRLMLGRDAGRVYPDREPPGTDVVLAAENVSGRLVQGVDVRIRSGEVVGITGLVGMGQDELPYLLYGALPLRSGRVSVDGTPVDRVGPRRMRAAGVALLPADRARASGAPGATVGENMTLPVLDRFFTGGRLRHARERSAVRGLITRYDVRPPRPGQRLGALSGGNQQKVLLAKWLQDSPRVVLLHEPTHGVDIASRAHIFRIIRAAADAGTGVLIASSEYEDLASLCDRVLVLHHGRPGAELSGAGLTEDALTRSCLLAAPPGAATTAPRKDHG